MSEIKVSVEHERLILSLEQTFPKLNIRNIKSPDFNLSERELYFKLGQRAVIDLLLEKLQEAKRNQYKE